MVLKRECLVCISVSQHACSDSVHFETQGVFHGVTGIVAQPVRGKGKMTHTACHTVHLQHVFQSLSCRASVVYTSFYVNWHCGRGL